MKPSVLIASLAFVACLATSGGLAQESPPFDKGPIPQMAPPPVYPAELNGESGMVSLAVFISEDGTVTKAEVLKSTHVALEKASVDAIKRWKFKPATKEGQPVQARITIPLRFNPPS